MNLFFVIPVIVAILVFVFVRLLKKKTPNKKLKYRLQFIGICCCVISIVAILASVYYSSDKGQLFKLSLPVLILIILGEQMRQDKKRK
jgi:L-asparagine transporter-like permease